MPPPLLYLVLALADVFSIGKTCNYWFHNAGILIGIVVTTYIASELIKKDKVKINKFLCDASFFVFAMHGLFISKYMKAIIMLFHPESPYVVLFIYFFVPLTTIIICLGIYYLLYKFMPSVAKIVTGGR